MPQLVFHTSYGINDLLVISPTELMDNYAFGIDIKASNFRSISDDQLRFFIRAAQKTIERELDLKLVKTAITETRDFMRDEWLNWNYIRCTYPIVSCLEIEGWLGASKQITFPIEWFTGKQSSDNDLAFRNIYLVPNGSTATSFSAQFTGILPMVAYSGTRDIPSYWHVKYLTGWDPDKIPADIIYVVGALAAIPVLMMLGNIVLGAGITNNSISIDGLSQSLGSSMSGQGGAFAGTVKALLEAVDSRLETLRSYYKGIVFTTV